MSDAKAEAEDLLFDEAQECTCGPKWPRLCDMAKPDPGRRNVDEDADHERANK